MPVVINEISIRVDAHPPEDSSTMRSDAAAGQDERIKEIVREAVDAVMDTLRNKKER